MTAARCLAACIVFAALAGNAAVTTAQVTRESTIQYALENMVSGTEVRARVGGAGMAVTPLRTWKSVSGHWCRRYRLSAGHPDASPADMEETRCRQDGYWKPLPE